VAVVVLCWYYLGAIHPSGRSKAHAITERVDEDEEDTNVVGDVTDVAEETDDLTWRVSIQLTRQGIAQEG
jgi:hypothetical protein